jgi:hypothetical protein
MKDEPFKIPHARSIAWLAACPFGPRIAFAPEDESGGGADGGTGDPDNEAAGGAGGDDMDSGPYRPDGLDETYHGETDRDTIDRLMAGLADASPTLPEDVSGYEFTPAEGLEGFFADKDDPLLGSAKAAALKHGIAPDQLQNFINDTFSDPVAKGMIAAPFNPKAEMDTLAKMLGGDTKLAEKAVNDAEAVASNIAKAMKLPDGAAGFFEGMAETAAGVMIIRAVQGMAKEKGIPLGDGNGGTSGGLSKEQLEKLGSDPRIDPRSTQYDPALRKQYDESFQALYPS